MPPQWLWGKGMYYVHVVRGNGLAVEPRCLGTRRAAGVRFLISAAAGRRSSALSTLNYCVVVLRSLVLCCAWLVYVTMALHVHPVAYLGFQKGGPRVRWTLYTAHTRGTKFSNFFTMLNKLLPKEGHGRFGQGVNTHCVHALLLGPTQPVTDFWGRQMSSS